MYSLNRRRNTKFNKPIHIISAIVIFAIILILSFHWSPAFSVLGSIQTKMFSISSSLNKIVIQTFSPTDSLKSQIDYYKNLAGQSMTDKAYLDALENRVSELESLLGYDQTVQYDTTVAKILSHSTTNKYTLLIDKGSHDNILPGFAVIVENGHLIGIIDSVSEYTSTIQLLEDPRTSVPVSIINNNQPSGLLIGEGGYLLKMQFVPQDREINIGDTVVTSNLFELIPDGLVIGAIKEIIEDESSPFKQAIIEPVFKATDYSDVLIIKSGDVKIYGE